MARIKPDIDNHSRALGVRSRRVLYGVRAAFASGWQPTVIHLYARDLAEIVGDMRGSGFDVARGVVFRGRPVVSFDAD